jgi:putative hydrolase of the HAD superfamily
MALKLVVFDMDDTLFLERSYVESGFRAVGELLGAEYGFTTFHEVAWKMFLNGRRGDIFDAALRYSGGEFPSDTVRRCVDVYRSHSPKIELLRDSVELLSAYQGVVHTGLVTDGPKASQRAKIQSLGLMDLVESLIVTDEHPAGWQKPGYRAFESMQQSFGLRGDECLYLGDNPTKDFVSPTALGWHTVRVRRAGGLHEATESASDAAAEVRDLTPLSLGRVPVLADMLMRARKN